MLRITGDLPGLLDVAEATNSLKELRERLAYLNEWGEASGCYVNVHLIIAKVNLEKKEADVCVKFFTNGKPEMYPVEPKATMIGGLNLYEMQVNKWNWSVNT